MVLIVANLFVGAAPSEMHGSLLKIRYFCSYGRRTEKQPAARQNAPGNTRASGRLLWLGATGE